jgi:hypothetical protein
MYRVTTARRKLSAGGVGQSGGGAGAAGVEMTTRHAFASPGRLGSIRARYARRRVTGTGPFDPRRTRPAARLPDDTGW